ncbi:MAG TPA: complex I NDUFA9 subunit family protein [Burkholderiales bacterium]|nr:complex I NDUFA9 subunit family protein [Burkholderiales bacterium]
MEINTVAVLGGSGFVGRHLCQALAAAGYRVRVATRDRERAKEQLILLPTVDVSVVDVHDPRALAEFLRGAEAAVNLIGVLHGGRGSSSFQAAHVELARGVVEACGKAGVRRLLHMSALKADANAPSAYLRSKAEAEAVVRGSGLDWTIFRPSVIFGHDDSFLNLFAEILKLLPVVVLGSPSARFQPVFVDDVAAAFAKALPDLGSHGRSYDLCGPRVYTLRQLVEFTAATTGHPRPIIGLGDSLSWLQALVMECLPVKLLTRDNVLSMKVDSVCDAPLPFGIEAGTLEALAPAWLANKTPRAHYQRFRAQRGNAGNE